MMKKSTYITPETELIRLCTEARILEVSSTDGIIPGTIPSNPIINENF